MNVWLAPPRSIREMPSGFNSRVSSGDLDVIFRRRLALFPPPHGEPGFLVSRGAADHPIRTRRLVVLEASHAAPVERQPLHGILADDKIVACKGRIRMGISKPRLRIARQICSPFAPGSITSSTTRS
jgi:hypothetical protein